MIRTSIRLPLEMIQRLQALRGDFAIGQEKASRSTVARYIMGIGLERYEQQKRARSQKMSGRPSRARNRATR